MTWSIVARDPSSGQIGIAISSRVIAVGALCPMFRDGVGALSSQSYTSPVAGERLLEALANGTGGQTAIGHALTGDDGHMWRQIHGVDAAGRPFAHTGARCIEWCGHWTGDAVSIAGNMLAGPQVLDATVAAWNAGSEAQPFADRLLGALEAGQAAGGDKRGRQSAALMVRGGEIHAAVDLRVDEHPDPVAELRRVFDLFWAERRPYMATLPTRENPSGIYDPDEREAFIAAWKAQEGAL
ncbi:MULTISPECIES: DUF1028 domain-containing protein [Thalassobaculum]|uniref:Uncharacterized conserved protein, Ntn-hydrolase superfamily n=1 Tax=Thalassobaculum litoreum DSM 18839 TaxID=1123362 RepID=A0A8G2BHR9_9PROT|nr:MULTISPECIES: DUF1028 domain-containing protein [Thalassobaculum]SDF40145.1 Uncharacterized conserved protein, Ntn-hydrolase superfamily [Thalassobaculum litoreum DSM 18839]